MKILITGATGFIGSHLAERLRASGHEVLCLSKDLLNTEALVAAGCTVASGDLMNGVDWDCMLKGVEMVYHVAGTTRCRSSHEYYEGNTLATRRLVEVCVSGSPGLRRFLYVSSLSAVGPSRDGCPVDESSPYHPVSHYGKSKMLAEQEVLKASDKLPVTIIRPSAVYGPRERDMYGYINLIRRGIEIRIGFNEKRISLIYVDDLVRGIQCAAELPEGVGNIYFLGSEESYSETDLGAAIARVVATHPLKLRLPHMLVYCIGAASVAAARLADRPVFFNLEKAKESTRDAWTCSVKKAITDLGFHQHVGLDEGMRCTYAWYCANGWF